MKKYKEKQKSISKPTETIWDMNKMDNLHFSWDDTLSYNKTWNFAFCQREDGKSVNSWVKIYNAFYYNGCPSIIIRRRIADMTSAYIDDIATLLNKFLKEEHQIQLLYLKGDVSSGIADVKIAPANEKITYAAAREYPTFFRIIGLSTPMNRIKSMMLTNVRYFFMDEFVINARNNEKYLPGNEYFMIQELYTTYNREAKRPITILAAGNPYSAYCPLFTGLEVDSSKLKPGAFVVGPNYVINCHELSPELREFILKHHPMYEFDDSYKRYAFGGETLNDVAIRVQKTEPRGFKLKWVFKLGNDFISIHYGKSDRGVKEPYRFWVCKHEKDWLSKVSKRRKIMVFAYMDLIEGAVRWSPADVRNFSVLKEAMRKREVTYNTIDASYMLEDVEMYL